MQLDIRYANHPDDVKRYDTKELRDKFLFTKAFVKDDISLCYSHQDRMVFGGAYPVSKTLKLVGGKEFATDVFLERRELGVICIAGEGKVTCDGKTYPMKKKDGLYVGMGTKDVEFSSSSPSNPAKFYLASSPAHQHYDTTFIPYDKAIHNHLGEQKNTNVRNLNQYIHPKVLKTCQLCMGMTELEEGSVWNTMPSHTHERRMEVYLYFDIPEGNVVFHMHGQPQETRHIVMHNEECVISPSWSIHSGVGTSNYTFIWAMAGENQDFDDMDNIYTPDLM
jgi:4-deoxy-L-threo-5-hexosulose-uronate ketol-isomerase